MTTTKKMALSSLITSMSVSIMLLSTIFPGGSLASGTVAGIVLVILSLECRGKWAFMSYVVSSLLSAFLVPDKEAVSFFIAFLGYYPILKTYLDKIKNKIFVILLKVLIFNAAMILTFFLAFRFFHILIEDFKIFGMKTTYFLLLLGNFIFWTYETLVTNFIKFYIYKLRNKIKINK